MNIYNDMNRIIITFITVIVSCHQIYSQENDSLQISRIYENALTNYDSYNHLKYLCKETPGRLAGSKASITAVTYLQKVLQSYKLDSVYLQKLKVPKWNCSSDPSLFIMKGMKKNKELNICALGPSVSTDNKGLTAQVIEVKNFGELEKLGKSKIKGTIVFFNRAMDSKLFNPAKAYLNTYDHRLFGASEASRYGAAAVIVRSLTTSIDTFPHTGVVVYNDTVPKIPAVAISTQDAELLHMEIKNNPGVMVKLTVTCKRYKPAESYNLIGEIKGREFPDEIILVGAHIDAWYNTPGAHDDGAGCVQMVDVVRIFKELSIRPKRTIRVVLFMDEEMEQTGAKEYAALTGEKKIRHYVAIESDRGGHTPRGFTIDADSSIISSICKFKKYFEPYKTSDFHKGFGGVDIQPLKKFGVPLIGFLCDNQRYFNYHHSANDTFDKINHRELQLGTASIASLVYLIDKYGIE